MYNRQNGVNGLEGRSLGVASLLYEGRIGLMEGRSLGVASLWRQNGVNGLERKSPGVASLWGLMVLIAKRAVGVASYRGRSGLIELLFVGHTLLTCKS